MSQVLSLKDYYSLINLQAKPYQPVPVSINYHELIHQIFSQLQSIFHIPSTTSIEQQRTFIRHALTIRDPSTQQRLSPHVYNVIDQMLLYERDHLKRVTIADHLPIQFSSLPYLRLWRGDITTLMIDAIVNAGNSALLGCFQPTHLCIDNVIHAAAGPRLRDDCYTIMSKQGQSEPVGQAKITAGYNLPAKYVIHTVGPQLSGNNDHITREDARALASCYESCLNLANEMQTIRSIAFCCISTGLFAFPQDQACHIAIETVTKWYNHHGARSKIALVVFNVFTDQDETLYTAALKQLAAN